MNSEFKREFYELLKEDFSLFDFIQNKAPDGIWYGNLLDPAEHWVNQRFWNMLGFSLNDNSQEKLLWQNLVHTQDYQKIQNLFNDPQTRQNKLKEITIRYMHNNGSYIHVNCTAKLIDNEPEKPRLLLCHNHIDCCELTENALKKSQERFELLIKNSADIFVELAKDGTQTYISPVVEYYTGHTPEELQRPFSEVIHPDDLEEVLEHWEEVLAQPGQSHRHEYRHIHKTKGYIWMEAHLQSFLDNPHINSVLCWVRDISEQKRIEQELKESKENLFLANAAKDKFFSILAHDLRNPFNLLLGYSEINLDYIKEKNLEKLKETGVIIKDITENGYSLLQNLLTWSRTQQGFIKYEPSKVNIEKSIKHIINQLSEYSGRKNIILNLEIESDSEFIMDKNMFGTIMRNLLSNAIKFSYPGGSIDIKALNRKNTLNVTVTDKGIGIRPETLKELFSIEESYSTEGTIGEKGTGLGLILCKELIEKHGGTIGVESQPGSGTTFWFTIPEPDCQET